MHVGACLNFIWRVDDMTKAFWIVWVLLVVVIAAPFVKRWVEGKKKNREEKIINILHKIAVKNSSAIKQLEKVLRKRANQSTTKSGWDIGKSYDEQSEIKTTYGHDMFGDLIIVYSRPGLTIRIDKKRIACNKLKFQYKKTFKRGG